MTRAIASHSWFLLPLMVREPEEKTPPDTTPDILSTSHFPVVSEQRFDIVEKFQPNIGWKDDVFIVQ